jgi:hypothetical protein
MPACFIFPNHFYFNFPDFFQNASNTLIIAGVSFHHRCRVTQKTGEILLLILLGGIVGGQNVRNPLISLARPAGLEPATF